MTDVGIEYAFESHLGYPDDQGFRITVVLHGLVSHLESESIALLRIPKANETAFLVSYW